MTRFEYKRFGHIGGKLTPWIWRIVCSCGFETEWVPQASGEGTVGKMDKRRAEHDAACPEPDVVACEDELPPSPAEQPGRDREAV